MVFQLIRWVLDQEGQRQFEGSIPHTAFYNTDKAQLLLGDRTTASIKSFHDVPKYIQLIAELNGKVCQSEMPITLTYVEHDHTYEATNLYPPGTLQDWYYESINIQYLGSGGYSDIYPSEVWKPLKGDNIPWGTLSLVTPLYCHQFKTQKSSLTVHQRKDAREVRGYGGYWRRGCSLKHIQQMFFTAGFEGGNSSFYLSSLDEWRNKNIDPSEISSHEHAQVEFIDCNGMLIKNLHKVILAGGMSFQLLTRIIWVGGRKRTCIVLWMLF